MVLHFCFKMSGDEILSAMQEIRELVHPRHSILTELRSRVIPAMTKRKGYGVMMAGGGDEDDFALKQRLCLENMSVINIIDPGLSPSRGRLLYELFSCVFERAQAGFLAGRTEDDEFYWSVEECKKLLAEGSRCLRNETNNNGKYEKWIKNSKTSLDGLTESIQ